MIEKMGSISTAGSAGGSSSSSSRSGGSSGSRPGGASHSKHGGRAAGAVRRQQRHAAQQHQDLQQEISALAAAPSLPVALVQTALDVFKQGDKLLKACKQVLPGKP